MNRTLADVVDALGRLAPLDLAEEWDNVGLLLAPTAQGKYDVSRRIGFTTDPRNAEGADPRKSSDCSTRREKRNDRDGVAFAACAIARLR